MHKKIEELQSKLEESHKDIAKYTQHLFDSIDEKCETHRRETAINAAAGVRPDKEEEMLFYRYMLDFKKMLLEELEKTTEDFEHKGDKYWRKHYKDGVDK